MSSMVSFIWRASELFFAAAWKLEGLRPKKLGPPRLALMPSGSLLTISSRKPLAWPCEMPEAPRSSKSQKPSIAT
eukprot:832968-Alexandrium_andersonii.AAC.1